MSLSPIALVTATSVDRRGLPSRTGRGKDSRAQCRPAALATLAMPWACARWRSNEQDTRFVFVFHGGFEVFGSKIRVLAEPSNDGLVMRNTGFTLQVLVLFYRIFKLS